MSTDWTSELYNIGFEEAIIQVTDFIRGYDEEIPVEELIDFLNTSLEWEMDYAVADELKHEEFFGTDGDDPLEEEDRYLRAGDPDETDDSYATLRSLRGRSPDAV